MPATEAQIDDLIAAIRARAEAGNDEAKLAWGNLGGQITDPTIGGETVEGTFDKGIGIRDIDGGSSAMKALVEGVADKSVETTPTGSVTMYAANSVPNGWLLCDGSAVSRTTYADLFAAIGTTFGVGDGSTTFNLPDIVQRFPRGTSGAPGATGGSDTNNHTHPISSDGSHTHPLSDNGGAKIRLATNGNIHTTDPTGPSFERTHWTALGALTASTNTLDSTGLVGDTDSAGAHDHGGATGTPSDTENRPAFIAMRFIIKT